MGPRIRQCVLKLVMHVDLTALQTNDWEFVLGKQIRISGESPSRVIYNNGGGVKFICQMSHFCFVLRCC